MRTGFKAWTGLIFILSNFSIVASSITPRKPGFMALYGFYNTLFSRRSFAAISPCQIALLHLPAFLPHLFISFHCPVSSRRFFPFHSVTSPRFVAPWLPFSRTFLSSDFVASRCSTHSSFSPPSRQSLPPSRLSFPCIVS